MDRYQLRRQAFRKGRNCKFGPSFATIGRSFQLAAEMPKVHARIKRLVTRVGENLCNVVTQEGNRFTFQAPFDCLPT